MTSHPTSAPETQETPDIAALRAALLEWFATQQRDLPWRHTHDPYATWLSEIMLQQTRVETVKPYFAKFLERYPTVTAMAAAPLADILALWSGLGYYRRARNLHKAAIEVVERFGGQFPDNLQDLLSLPGVGRYTAGAIASIAFDLPHAAVDGNVHRVMARVFGIEQARSSAQLDKESWVWAEQLVVGEAPGDFNQSLMELGALICTPRSPTCLLCPIRQWCQSYAAGEPERLPLAKTKTQVKELQVLWALLRRRGKVLLIQRPEEGLFAGMWELPGCYLNEATETPQDALQTHLSALGLTTTLKDTPASYTHILTHRRLSISLYESKSLAGSVLGPRSRWRWVDPHDLPHLAMSSITQRILREQSDQPPPA